MVLTRSATRVYALRTFKRADLCSADEASKSITKFQRKRSSAVGFFTAQIHGGNDMRKCET